MDAIRKLFRSSCGRRRRRGAATLEEVLVTGVMLPLVAGVLFLGIKFCQAVYNITAALVGWPYL